MELSVKDKLEFAIKGSSKFVILALALIAFAWDVVSNTSASTAHFGDLAVLFLFVVYAVRVMERQRKKFGRLIH